jgi:hypothetical protein
MMQYFDAAFDHEPIGSVRGLYHHYACAVKAGKAGNWVASKGGDPTDGYVSGHSACHWCITNGRDVNFNPVLLAQRPANEDAHFL